MEKSSTTSSFSGVSFLTPLGLLTGRATLALPPSRLLTGDADTVLPSSFSPACHVLRAGGASGSNRRDVIDDEDPILAKDTEEEDEDGAGGSLADVLGSVP